MIHNPTIYGVPRALLETLATTDVNLEQVEFFRAIKKLRALLATPAPDLRDHCKQCAETVSTWPEWKQESLGGLKPSQIAHGTQLKLKEAQATIAQQAAMITELIAGWDDTKYGDPPERLAKAVKVARSGQNIYWCKPVAEVVDDHGFNIIQWCAEDYPVGTKLYTAPPAPAALVLPERKSKNTHYSHDWDEGYADGWIAYYAELKRLNPSL